ncbi:MAG: CoA pyrophosphatase [Desulfobacterales bacterium]|jgi:8-oxo-dGTP pyrophosphatase MutT (NUDIX family)|nr:coenzyme A pyrophosphatase [Desulfobacter sp.]MDP6683335.1 CoA pyrophosphatase [Desulfobacterales bacterium]MDP6808968.1 CoA pyrophosphatase [Desulfobacterales bacterium]|tara:strand:- start:8115 stop:8705 length:591 start_codon:yes stop_codon:yes gene_type:complete
MENFIDLDIDSAYLKQIIRNTTHRKAPGDVSYQLTSVFLLLFFRKEPCLLAIQKSDNEGYPWRNQVALPGGHVDKADASPMDAAYRELEEEVNIPRNQIDFIGSMGHFQTINNKDIEVFVGIWNGKGPLAFDSEEIQRVFEVPFKKLVRTHKEDNFHGHLPDTPTLLYPHEDVVIWGATARILHYFIELLYPALDI